MVFVQCSPANLVAAAALWQMTLGAVGCFDWDVAVTSFKHAE